MTVFLTQQDGNPVMKHILSSIIFSFISLIFYLQEKKIVL